MKKLTKVSAIAWTIYLSIATGFYFLFGAFQFSWKTGTWNLINSTVVNGTTTDYYTNVWHYTQLPFIGWLGATIVFFCAFIIAGLIMWATFE